MSMQWEFNGSNGCPRCQALTGIYENVPGRPHNYCDCEIVKPEGARERDCADWDYDILENNILDAGSNEIREMKVRGILTCCDGRRLTGEFEYEWETSDKSESDANAEIYQEIEGWASYNIENYCIGLG